VLEETKAALHASGLDGHEGFVLWLGTIASTESLITEMMAPPQRPIKSEDGVGYFIEGHTLFQISRYLSEKRLRMVAQVHSHPTEAYHSKTDDDYAIVTEEGGFSLVVPDFARGPALISAWAVYRLSGGRWRALPASELRRTFTTE
jgi:hypothetical protein